MLYWLYPHWACWLQPGSPCALVAVSPSLENLTATVDAMEAGNLNLFANEEGPHELRRLASGINQLATSVRQYNVRMQSEVARATAQLQITLIELEDAMEARISSWPE